MAAFIMKMPRDHELFKDINQVPMKLSPRPAKFKGFYFPLCAPVWWEYIHMFYLHTNDL